jgi:class 3 adenylate cyclase
VLLRITRVSLIFADVRGSTNLAAKVRSSEYIRLMQRFYATATRILIKSNAYIDKLIGDEVMAIYLPAMSGTHGARDAVFKRAAMFTVRPLVTNSGEALGDHLKAK